MSSTLCNATKEATNQFATKKHLELINHNIKLKINTYVYGSRGSRGIPRSTGLPFCLTFFGSKSMEVPCSNAF